MKGLFTVLSPNEFWPFAAYGLHAQRTVDARDYCGGVERKSTHPMQALREQFFKAHWLSSPSPSPLDQLLRGGDDGNEGCDLWRFSRCSCPDPARLKAHCQHGSGSDRNEQYVFLALCRILTVHLKTVEGPLTQEEIRAAQAHNFDAVQSSLT